MRESEVGTFGLPRGAVAWFAEGRQPPGFARLADVPGRDTGWWELLPPVPDRLHLPELFWTGSELIGLGWQYFGIAALVRFSVETSNWSHRATFDGYGFRFGTSTVWTGEQLIVWGGQHGNVSPWMRYLNDGAAYDPSTDAWVAITSEGAPSPRSYHSAVWTGEELIVWGGVGAGQALLNDGARYRDGAWTPITTAGAPAGCESAATVWTGSELIVWGRQPSGLAGGRYHPATNTWAAMSAPPILQDKWDLLPFDLSRATYWTGTEMAIAVGAEILLYNPSSDTWRVLAGRRTADSRLSSHRPARLPSTDYLVSSSGFYDLADGRLIALHAGDVSGWLPLDLLKAGSDLIGVDQDGGIGASSRVFRHIPDVVFCYVKE